MTTPFDTMLEALADAQRRKLLVRLLDHNPQGDAPVVDAGADGDAVAAEQLIKMEHVHLPKLEDHGFIEWDRQHHEVVKGPAFDEIRPLLELLVAHEDDLPEGWM